MVLAFLALVLKPRNRWLYFFAFLYIFSLVPELLGNTVFSLPFGFAFRILSLFLIPSAIGIAALIGFSSDALLIRLSNLKNNKIKKCASKVVAVTLLALIMLSGVPWWIGQTSGQVATTPATKLNLAELPSGYVNWSSFVTKNDTGMFVLYWPLAQNLELLNVGLFRSTFQGVNNPLFQSSTSLSPVIWSDALFRSLSDFF